MKLLLGAVTVLASGEEKKRSKERWTKHDPCPLGSQSRWGGKSVSKVRREEFEMQRSLKGGRING